MTSDRWQQIDQLLETALEREPSQRAAFLEQACEGDEALRREVEVLLTAHAQAGSAFLAVPALDVAAKGLAAEQAHTLVGQRVGPYQILSLVGRGGMGEVYLAEDQRLRRKVALKLLPPAFTYDPERVRRFEQEARATSMLNHPNILTIFEVGQVDAMHFIVTEFVEGEPLREHLARGRMSLRDVLHIGIQVAGALTTAHAAGIVHRDIKPENLMLRPDGYVKVLDFGLAKLTEQLAPSVDTEAKTLAKVETRPGVVMGTVVYMSPEQLRGQAVDARSDIFSLGIVLYEMIAGRGPFEGETASDVMAAILKTEPPPLRHAAPDVPRELEHIVGKALRKDREVRYQNVKDLLIDLNDLKQELELAAKMGRSLHPHEDAEAAETADALGTSHTAGDHAVPTAGEAVARTTSSAEYLVDEIRRHRKGAALVLAVLVAVLGAAAYFAALAPRPQAITSIAVLPFANASGEQNLDYLSEGVSESLIDRLSQVPQLKVVARSSSFRYTGREVDLQEVARALGVEAIVTGQVVQRGEGLALRAELVDARDNTHIWGNQYGLKGTDLQGVQEAIAHAISEKLQVRLTGVQEQHAAQRPTANPEAYQLYLNGNYYRRKAGQANLRTALDYYNRAIALDPDFALAIADAAWIHLRLLDHARPQEAMARAKAAAMKAVELDETLAQAHSVLGLVAVEEWDWSGAEREFKRSIELNPNLASARAAYAFYLTSMGRHTEALAQIDRAQELDPLNLNVRSHRGLMLAAARRYDEATPQLQSILELEPDHRLALERLAYAFAAKGLYAEAIATHQKLLDLEGRTEAGAGLGYLYAMSGRREEALALLEKLKTTKEYVSPYELARLYVGLGDREEAFAYLERAYTTHDQGMQDLKVDSFLEPLRSDPRFTDLLRRVGLAP
jgi:eukaryotic-like serine/threonine-protein kinase